MIDETFKKKYLKYKTKYINLTNILYGGGDRTIINDLEQLKLLIEQNGPEYLQLASDELKGNVDIVKKALFKNGLTFQYISLFLQQNKNLALIAVKNNGLAIQYFSKKLQSDEDIIKAAVNQNAEAYTFIPKQISEDVDFIVNMIKINKNIYKYISEDYIKYNNTIIQALNSTKTIYFYESDGTENTISNSFNLEDLIELKSRIRVENLKKNKYMKDYKFSIYIISNNDDDKTQEQLKINLLDDYYNELIKFDFFTQTIKFNLLWDVKDSIQSDKSIKAGYCNNQACNKFGIIGKSLFRCTSCYKVGYDNKECQIIDWNTGRHELKCPELGAQDYINLKK